MAYKRYALRKVVKYPTYSNWDKYVAMKTNMGQTEGLTNFAAPIVPLSACVTRAHFLSRIWRGLRLGAYLISVRNAHLYRPPLYYTCRASERPVDFKIGNGQRSWEWCIIRSKRRARWRSAWVESLRSLSLTYLKVLSYFGSRRRPNPFLINF